MAFFSGFFFCVCAALRDDLYFEVGSLLALSLVHGGPPVAFFSHALYYSLFHYPTDYKFTAEDLGDVKLANTVKKVGLRAYHYSKDS